MQCPVRLPVMIRIAVECTSLTRGRKLLKGILRRVKRLTRPPTPPTWRSFREQPMFGESSQLPADREPGILPVSSCGPLHHISEPSLSTTTGRPQDCRRPTRAKRRQRISRFPADFREGSRYALSSDNSCLSAAFPALLAAAMV
jgi:hypothetical protein